MLALASFSKSIDYCLEYFLAMAIFEEFDFTIFNFSNSPLKKKSKKMTLYRNFEKVLLYEMTIGVSPFIKIFDSLQLWSRGVKSPRLAKNVVFRNPCDLIGY